MTLYHKGDKGTVDVMAERSVAWWQYGLGECVLCNDGGDPTNSVFIRPKTDLAPFYVCIACVKAMWALRPGDEEVAP